METVAYTRFGWDDSEVYVYMHIGGWLDCCSCRLKPSPHGSVILRSTDAMVAHLREHEAAGHVVPAEVFVELERDREENDAWMQEMLGLRS
jgi:hypothetical protein